MLHVKDSRDFERDGNDLIYGRRIGIAQAALGCKLKIPTLDGEKEIEIPAGTQHGQRVTIPGSGVPHLKGIGRGDLHVQVEIAVPKKLSKEQRELLEKYAALAGEEATSGGGGFFKKVFRD